MVFGINRLVKPAHWHYAHIWRNNYMPGGIKRWVNKRVNSAKISLTIAN
ncbi:hypothetical protein FHW89_005592 [Mucilaginibacter sp. SG564]|nr:hypothetical protein [Mucilaginibacter sp. SG564]